MLIEATQALSEMLALKIAEHFHVRSEPGWQLTLQFVVFAVLLFALCAFFIALFALVQDALPFAD